jgi:hypothetical protein
MRKTNPFGLFFSFVKRKKAALSRDVFRSFRAKRKFTLTLGTLPELFLRSFFILK